MLNGYVTLTEDLMGIGLYVKIGNKILFYKGFMMLFDYDYCQDKIKEVDNENETILVKDMEDLAYKTDMDGFVFGNYEEMSIEDVFSIIKSRPEYNKIRNQLLFETKEQHNNNELDINTKELTIKYDFMKNFKHKK